MKRAIYAMLVAVISTTFSVCGSVAPGARCPCCSYVCTIPNGCGWDCTACHGTCDLGDAGVSPDEEEE